MVDERAVSLRRVVSKGKSGDKRRGGMDLPKGMAVSYKAGGDAERNRERI